MNKTLLMRVISFVTLVCMTFSVTSVFAEEKPKDKEVSICSDSVNGGQDATGACKAGFNAKPADTLCPAGETPKLTSCSWDAEDTRICKKPGAQYDGNWCKCKYSCEKPPKVEQHGQGVGQ